ncbi:MAG TPA: FliG C-terminal domain-containing protein [Anaeromyxobacteraceae bacterium]|jgi:flagellar motor switch protein FliG
MPDAAPPAHAVPEGGPGSKRAAAVLLGVGPEVATSLFKQLGEGDLRLVAMGAKGLRRMTPTSVGEALGAFVLAMEGIGGDTLAGDELLRDTAARALGDAAARRAFDGVLPPSPPDEVLGPVSQAEPESLAMVLQHEQPQTAALVISSLGGARAAAVVDRLPEKMRPDILRRMAAIESVSPEVLREIGAALSSELKAVVAGGMRKVDGKAITLEILRRCSAQQQSEVIAEIEKDSQPLATELRGKLFTFEDLKTLADRDLQTLLREIDTNKLGVALKGATPEVKQKFMQNLSSRAAAMLEDDLAAMGPVKLSTVETAQAEIARIALEAAQQGRIAIVGPTEAML